MSAKYSGRKLEHSTRKSLSSDVLCDSHGDVERKLKAIHWKNLRNKIVMESVDNASNMPTSPKPLQGASKGEPTSPSPKKVTGLPVPIATNIDSGTTDENLALKPDSVPGNVSSPSAEAQSEFKPRYIRTGMFHSLFCCILN